MFIPGQFIALLTFPGVIVHELGHKLFCDIFKVKVHEAKYFRFGNPAGYVIHDIPDRFHKTFFIDVGPFIVNNIMAIIIFSLSTLFAFNDLLWAFFVWLGVSIAMNSFPSSHDAKVLWSESKKHLSKGNIIAIIGFPFSILIRIANALSIVWFDLIFAIILYITVTGTFAAPSIFEGRPQTFVSNECGFSIDITTAWKVDNEKGSCYFAFGEGKTDTIMVFASNSSAMTSPEFVLALLSVPYTKTGVEYVTIDGTRVQQISANVKLDGQPFYGKFAQLVKDGKYYLIGYVSKYKSFGQMAAFNSFRVI